MKALLKLDAEQAHGVVAAELGDVRHRGARSWILEVTAGEIEPLVANPLGGRAAEPFAEGILQRSPRIVALGLQHGEIEWLGEIELDVVDEFIDGIPPLSILFRQPIERGLQAKFRQQQRRDQPVNLIIELEAIHQCMAAPQQLVSLAQLLAEQGVEWHLTWVTGEAPLMAVLDLLFPAVRLVAQASHGPGRLQQSFRRKLKGQGTP